MSTTCITHHTCRREHKHSCEWCGEKIMPGDKWEKNATFGGGDGFWVSEMHEECAAAFYDEFQHYWPGSLLGFYPRSNDRGQPAKEGTIYEV